MLKQTIVFGIRAENSIITKIGISAITVPKTKFNNQSSTKWFDDSKLKKR